VPTTPTVLVLVKGGTRTGRLWTYATAGPLAGQISTGGGVLLLARSRRRASGSTVLARYADLMQADAYSIDCTKLAASRDRSSRLRAGRTQGASFFDLAGLRKAPIAIEAVERNDRPPRHRRGMCHKKRQRLRDAGHSSLSWGLGCASSAPSTGKLVGMWPYPVAFAGRLYRHAHLGIAISLIAPFRMPEDLHGEDFRPEVQTPVLQVLRAWPPQLSRGPKMTNPVG